MTLAAGTRLGPYEIVAPLGAGGMGEVYRARDERLKREVAIKVLPGSFSDDADRLRRFEQEAQAAGALNHSNITAVYDLGTHEGAPYIVTELLEGETLRARLSGGALPTRKAIDYALQIAHGLAAAHEKGIVHRDLKPENLFLTKDGRVKILDFGLAKLTQIEAAAGGQTNLPTAAGTEPGVVLGTLGYMSPEQIRGKPADPRSDIFSFGAILYEMLSGSRAFHGDTAADTMTAILTKEPPELSETSRNVHPGLERVVRHCLEKNPEERFHSAHDLAFDLESLSGLSTPQASAAAVIAGPAARLRIAPGLAVLALVAALGTGYLLGSRKAAPQPPSYHQLTFRRGPIYGARFGSDGKTILYSASWDGKPTEIYVSRRDSPESRPFGLPGADILAVSPTGDLAVALSSRNANPFSREGTLARVGATGGGAPREMLEKVEYADWSPDGKDIAVVRFVSGRTRLELPIGKVLYETTGWVGDLRFSPTGDRIAFLDHPVVNDDGGTAAIIDRAGKKTTISSLFASAQGLAWSPDGSEVWFTATEVGGNRALHAATPSGRHRVLARVTGSLFLHDTSRDGRVLMTHDLFQVGLVALGAGESKERDLSWLDWSLLGDLSADGKRVLFTESGEGGGSGYSVYIRGTDGSPAVRLGEGTGLSLSPDGKRVLAQVHPTTDQQLAIYPTGAGESVLLPRNGLQVRGARWMPDGRRFLMGAAEPGHGSRLYLWDAEGGKARALTPERYRGLSVSADGKRILVRGPDERSYVWSIDGGEPTPIPGVTADDGVIGWAQDGASIFVRKGGDLPARIVRMDLATGRSEKWRDLMPADATGVNGVGGFRISPDGKSYVFGYSRTLSDLYLVEGLK
jgi:Tol biopolymer transport system component